MSKQRVLAALSCLLITLSVSACGAFGGGEKAASDAESAVEAAEATVSETEALTISEPDSRPEAPVGPPDADTDGVADADDFCPETPVGMSVDDEGCQRFFGAIDGLEFPPDAATLQPGSQTALDGLIADLKAEPDVVIAVDGHTDNRGRAADNLELSKQRVMAVVRYLVDNGIAPSRLKPFGYGEGRPRQSNATPEGRRANRRIEIRQVGT